MLMTLLMRMSITPETSVLENLLAQGLAGRVPLQWPPPATMLLLHCDVHLDYKVFVVAPMLGAALHKSAQYTTSTLVSQSVSQLISQLVLSPYTTST